MTQFLAWLPWIGLAAAMVAVWVGTSYFWLRLARIPAAAAIAAARPEGGQRHGLFAVEPHCQDRGGLRGGLPLGRDTAAGNRRLGKGFGRNRPDPFEQRFVQPRQLFALENHAVIFLLR